MIMLNKPLKDVFIAIPTNQGVVAGLVPKLIKWASQGAEVCVLVSMPLVDLARNKAVKAFLASKKNYLLFIDSDTVPEVDGPIRLKKVKKQVSAGVYNLLMGDKGQAVIRPSCFTLAIEGRPLTEGVPIIPDTGIQKVTIASTGFLMIHRSVFETIPQPWFEYRWLDPQHDVFNGEDIDFCHKLEKAGIPIYCDTGAKALHYKSLFI